MVSNPRKQVASWGRVCEELELIVAGIGVEDPDAQLNPA